MDLIKNGTYAAGSLYPPIAALRRVTARIEEAVLRHARDAGIGRPFTDREIPVRVADAMWEPRYLPLVPAAESSPLRAEPARR